MKAAYTREKDMLEHQRFPLSKAIEEWETKPTIDIRRWLKRNIPYIKQCIKIHKAQIKNQTQDIRTFYIGTTQDTPTTSTQTQRKKQKQQQCRRQIQTHPIQTFFTQKRSPNSLSNRPRRPTKKVKDQDRPPDTIRAQTDMFDYYKITTS
jgi:hypothetical protein